MKNKTIYKISAIVPAYNEEKTLQRVLSVLIKSAYIDEVICINDGSTDKTEDKARQVKGVLLMNIKENKGKSYAIARGLKKARGDIVIFIDADLEGLSDKNIKDLVEPLTKREFDAVIGYYSNSNIDELFRPLSGERAYFKKDLIVHLKDLEDKGYGLELHLNYLFRNKKVKICELHGVRHYLKHEKQPYDTVARLLLRESRDILSQILKQRNPVEYFANSYFTPFYFQKPSIIKRQANKLVASIKKIQREITEFYEFN